MRYLSDIMTKFLSILAIVLVLFAFGASVVSSERYENDNKTIENDTIIGPVITNHTEENNVIVPNNETNDTTTITPHEPSEPSDPAQETTNVEPIIPAVQANGGVVIVAISPTCNEKVVIQNNNNFTAHLEGWELFNACGKLTTFPDIDVKSGKTLTVYAKAGTDTEEAFYLNKTKPIFKDTGGTAYLFCACGNETSTFKN